METKNLSYEEAMKQLDAVLQKLDAGDLPLEESISCFQDGLEYIKHCQSKLAAAEGALKILRGDEFVDMQESM